MNFRLKLKTFYKLGLLNIIRVAAYQVLIKFRLHPAVFLQSDIPVDEFYFREGGVGGSPESSLISTKLFGWKIVEFKNLYEVNWLSDPMDGGDFPGANRSWYEIPDFADVDIKRYWELSRFQWLPEMVVVDPDGDRKSPRKINLLLHSWVLQNRPYLGPNWKCGQEAAFRVIYLCMAAKLLGEAESPSESLRALVAMHLKRIEPTMPYAIAQRNNHAMTEAAALYMGGTLLDELHPMAARWIRKGKRGLDVLLDALVEPDGTFSQYSINYHRLMLDIYSAVLWWGREQESQILSERSLGRLKAAAHWLETMVDSGTGGAPNIGANDGAYLFSFSGLEFHDYRSSIQLVWALLDGRNVYGEGSWNRLLTILGVTAEDKAMQQKRDSQSFEDGGFHVLRSDEAMAVMRFPRFKFRPSHADLLHVDVWVGGENILRDAGSYSYQSQFHSWYAGTAAHNTVTFDGRDQMPRLGRFLFSGWPDSFADEPLKCTDVETSVKSGYKDHRGALHKRMVKLSNERIVIEDYVGGNFATAVLRWRLCPRTWDIRDGEAYSDGIRLRVAIDGKLAAPSVGTTFESRNYLQVTRIPELSWHLEGPCRIETQVFLHRCE